MQKEQAHHFNQKAKVFFARWFPSREDVGYAKMEKVGPVIEHAGHSSYCVFSENSISGGIDDESIAQILQSRFLTVNLSDKGNQGCRPVYYEAGLAHGQGLQVIHTCQRQQFRKKELP